MKKVNYVFVYDAEQERAKVKKAYDEDVRACMEQVGSFFREADLKVAKDVVNAILGYEEFGIERKLNALQLAMNVDILPCACGQHGNINSFHTKGALRTLFGDAIRGHQEEIEDVQAKEEEEAN